MEDKTELRRRDPCKQSVVLQRTEGSDQKDPLMLRRRSLTVAHLYLTSASLSRTRSRSQSLSQSVAVQTSDNSDSGSDREPEPVSQRPKSAYPFERPKLEYSSSKFQQEGLPQRPKSEYQKPAEVPTVKYRPRVTFERPKSERPSARPVVEYRDVVLRDQKRVIPRLSRSEREEPFRSRNTHTGTVDSKKSCLRQRKA